MPGHFSWDSGCPYHAMRDLFTLQHTIRLQMGPYVHLRLRTHALCTSYVKQHISCTSDALSDRDCYEIILACRQARPRRPESGSARLRRAHIVPLSPALRKRYNDGFAGKLASSGGIMCPPC